MYAYARTRSAKFPNQARTLPMDFGRSQSRTYPFPSNPIPGTGRAGSRQISPRSSTVHAALEGGGLPDLRPEHPCGREVRPRGGVGKDHLVPDLPSVYLKPSCEQETRELSLGARRGLQRDRVHPADLRENLLELVEDAERALHRRWVLIRMDPG